MERLASQFFLAKLQLGWSAVLGKIALFYHRKTWIKAIGYSF